MQYWEVFQKEILETILKIQTQNGRIKEVKFFEIFFKIFKGREL